jgi:hypothetical protein
MGVKEHERLTDALDQVGLALEAAREAIAFEADATEPETLRDVALRFHVSEEVLLAFAKTLGEVAGEREIDVADGIRAALLVFAGRVWEDELGPLLASAQVRGLLGGVSRQRVDELLRGRRLIGLRDSSGRRRFPVFQFAENGQPIAVLVDAFWTIADVTVSEWTAASWCTRPDDALEGVSPAVWAREGRDPLRLARIARQDAARLAQ